MSRVLGILLLCCALVAHAEVTDPVVRSKIHYAAGERFFAAGAYEDAIREFTAGYELAPRPKFLLNLAQTYRRLGDLTNAIRMYERFIAATPAEEPLHAEAREILAQLRDAQRTSAPVLAPATVTAPAVKPPPPSTIVTVAATEPAATPRPVRSAWRRLWWVLPVSIVGAGGALALGLTFGLRGAGGLDCQGTAACIDASRGR